MTTLEKIEACWQAIRNNQQLDRDIHRSIDPKDPAIREHCKQILGGRYDRYCKGDDVLYNWFLGVAFNTNVIEQGAIRAYDEK